MSPHSTWSEFPHLDSVFASRNVIPEKDYNSKLQLIRTGDGEEDKNIAAA